MIEKKALQDDELDKVVGGTGGESHIIHCKNCNNDFDSSTTNFKLIHNRTFHGLVFQCPNCQKYVTIDGDKA